MIDREKVIKGLEYHMQELGVGKTCFGCSYFGDNPCEILLIEDVLELLEDDETQLIYRDEIIKAHEDEIERLNKLLKEQEQKYGRWVPLTGMAPPEYHGHKICSICECLAPYDPIHVGREGGKRMTATEFMAHIIAEICKFAIDNDMEPDDTLEIMANNILGLLKISTFNHWEKEETN